MTHLPISVLRKVIHTSFPAYIPVSYPYCHQYVQPPVFIDTCISWAARYEPAIISLLNSSRLFGWQKLGQCSSWLLCGSQAAASRLELRMQCSFSDRPPILQWVDSNAMIAIVSEGVVCCLSMRWSVGLAIIRPISSAKIVNNGSGPGTTRVRSTCVLRLQKVGRRLVSLVPPSQDFHALFGCWRR